MKILISATDGRGYFGGPYEWLKRLGPALRAIGHDVSFAFLTDHDERECTAVRTLRAAGFECRCLRRSSVTQLRDHTEARVRWFVRQAAEVAPDLFIENSLLQAIYAGEWVARSGVPSVTVIHSDDAMNRALLLTVRGRTTFGRPHGVVCVSEALAAKARIDLGEGAEIFALSCGTPVPAFSACAPEAGAFRVAYAGKFTEEQKRISELTSALCRVTREVEGIEAVLFGRGNDAENVARVIEQEDVAGRVRTGGFVPSEEIQERLSQFHAIVLLSDYEGLPVVLLEAMACGVVPVCLANGSGVEEIVLNDRTGLLVADRDRSFVEAVRRLKEEPGLWSRLSRNARELVREKYSTEVVARRWGELGERLSRGVAQKTRIRVPRRVELPPVMPTLASEDRRKPDMTAYLREQMRRMYRPGILGQLRDGNHAAS